jgi:hypothetical protein
MQPYLVPIVNVEKILIKSMEWNRKKATQRLFYFQNMFYIYNKDLQVCAIESLLYTTSTQG